MATQDVQILLRAINQASGVLSQVKRDLDGVASAGTKAGQGVKGATGSDLFGGFLKNAAAMAAGLGVFTLARQGASAFGDAMIGMNGQLEQAQVGFTTMLGSAEAASSFIGQLQKFAQTTPFQFPDLLADSRKLLAYGFTAQEVIPMLTAVGDASAAMGGGGEMVNRITVALGQMRAKGSIQAEEMRQLAESGIPAWEMLANAIGTDIPTAMQLVESRAVPAARFLQIFQEQAGKRYGNMMAAQSQTFVGAMSNVTDTAQMAVARGFQPLFNSLRNGAVDLANFLMSPGFQQFVTNVQAVTQSMVNLGGQVANIAGVAAPVMIAVAAFSALNLVVNASPAALTGLRSNLAALPGLLQGIATGINPVTIAIAATLVVLLVFYTAWTKNWGGIRTNTEESCSQMAKNIAEYRQSIFDTIPAVKGLADAVGDWWKQQQKVIGDNPAAQQYLSQTEGFGGGTETAYGKPIADAGRSALQDVQDSAGEIAGGVSDALSKALGGVKVPGMPEMVNAARDAGGLATASDAAASRVANLKDNLDAARDAASATRDALSAAKDELQRFANAAFPGEWALQDRMGQLDTQIAQIKEGQAQKQLDRLMRRPLRTPGQQLKALELQKEIAGYQMTPYEEQHRQLQRLASDQVTMTFAEAAAGVSKSKSVVSGLEAELKAREANVKAAEDAVKIAEKAAKTLPPGLTNNAVPTVTPSLAQINRSSYAVVTVAPSLADINRSSYGGTAQPPSALANTVPYVAPSTPTGQGGPMTLQVNVTVTGVGTELAQEIAKQTTAAFSTFVGGQSRTAGAAAPDLPGNFQ